MKNRTTKVQRLAADADSLFSRAERPEVLHRDGYHTAVSARKSIHEGLSLTLISHVWMVRSACGRAMRAHRSKVMRPAGCPFIETSKKTVDVAACPM